jgi:hypothetical protein
LCERVHPGRRGSLASAPILSYGSNDVGDGSTGDCREALIFEQGGVCGALRCSMEAVPGQLRELRLGGEPPTLLAEIGGQHGERLPVETGERLRLVERPSAASGTRFDCFAVARRGGEGASVLTGAWRQAAKPGAEREPSDADACE